MYGAGFYMYSIIALLFWETRRSDFGLSMTHHVASVFLIAMSYIFRYFRLQLSGYSSSWFDSIEFQCLFFYAAIITHHLVYLPFVIIQVMRARLARVQQEMHVDISVRLFGQLRTHAYLHKCIEMEMGGRSMLVCNIQLSNSDSQCVLCLYVGILSIGSYISPLCL